MLFGDKVTSRGDSEYAPRRIDQSSSDTRRTLFEDVFGASALAAGTSTDHTVHEATSESHNAQHALSKFTAPAYLAPPIDSLYSSLMDHFVSKLPERGPSIEEVETHQDEEMAVDEDTPAVNVSFVGRTVDENEFNGLVTLFRNQSLCPTPKKAIMNGTPNGKHKALQQNGLTRAVSSPLSAPNGLSSETPPPAPRGLPNGQASSVPDSDSPVVGKKRKTGQIS